MRSSKASVELRWQLDGDELHQLLLDLARAEIYPRTMSKDIDVIRAGVRDRGDARDKARRLDDPLLGPQQASMRSGKCRHTR